MSSYFDYYCKNVCDKKTKERNDSDKIYGTCFCMCPKDEETLRIKENLVHILEMVGSERKLVKSYTRSAADSNMAVPKNLRPSSVLQNTVKYLLFDVTKRNDVPIFIVYDFINDRLRAVRQDMTIQRLGTEECLSLLDPMIRFYVYFGYRLYGLPLKDYDPVLNKKYLLECIKWFLNCCDDIDSNSEMDKLTNTMIDMNINEKHSYDRILMEGVYILSNLEDAHPLLRYISLSKELKMHPTLRLSFQIGLANLKGNFVRVVRSLDKLCPLLFCALCLHLPHLQRRGLLVLSHGFSSGRLRVASAAVRGWLALASDWETRALCTHYGLTVDGTEILFNKDAFNKAAPLHQAKIQMLHTDLNLNMNHVFTYNAM